MSTSACRLIPKSSLQSQALPELNRNIPFCAYFQSAKLLLSKIKLKKVAEADVALQCLLENLTHNHNVPLSSGAAKWDKPMSPRAAGEQQRCWAGEHSLQPPELLQLFLPSLSQPGTLQAAHSKAIHSKVSCSNCTELIPVHFCLRIGI